MKTMWTSEFHLRKACRTEHYFRLVYGWRLRPCVACNGSGRYDNHGSPKCGSCEGTGKERYRGPKAIKPMSSEAFQAWLDSLPGCDTVPDTDTDLTTL